VVRKAVEAIRRNCRRGRDHGKSDEGPSNEKSDPMHRVLQRLAVQYQAREPYDRWSLSAPKAVLQYVHARMCTNVLGL
jgi:hypothetical protein